MSTREKGEAIDSRKKPSQYVAEGNLYFPATPEDSLLPTVISRLGDQHLFFASDFPHEKSTHEEFIEHIDEMFALDSISAEAKRKIMYGNAKNAYNLS